MLIINDEIVVFILGGRLIHYNHRYNDSKIAGVIIVNV